MIPITQTLLAGLLPFAIVAAILLGLQVRHSALRSLTLPLLVGVFAGGLAVANFLGIGDPQQGALLLRGALWFLAVVLVLRGLAFYTFTVLLERQLHVRVSPLLPRVARGFLYLAAAFTILSVSFPGTQVGPLLATSAVTSLVLGLALQPILTNFFAGVVLSLERPFRINDWIQIGDHDGRVTAITWRTTAIRTRENDTVIFPNANVAQEKVINFLYPHPLHLARIYVGVHYRTPPHAARAAILAACSRVEGVLDRPTADVHVHAFDDSAVTYELRAWIDDMAALRRIESDARAEIWEEFRRQGIVIPFPIRTVEIARPRRSERRADEPPPARLFVSAGGGRGARLRLGADPVVVGRDPTCDLCLPEPRASKRHARVEWRDGRFRLEDLGSTHGTRLNGEPVAEAVLSDLDKVVIGDTILVIEIEEHGDT